MTRELPDEVGTGRRIRLTKIEQRLAIHTALERQKANRSQNVTNNRIGPQSDEETDREGVGAELAFCRLMNVYPDLSTSHRPPEDCELRTGVTVDVKATTYRNGRLLVVRWKRPDVDIFALMVGTFPEYRFCGFAPSEELLQEDKLVNMGHGLSYGMTQKELHQPRTEQ